MDKDNIGGMPFGQTVVPESEMTPTALRIFKQELE